MTLADGAEPDQLILLANKIRGDLMAPRQSTEPSQLDLDRMVQYLDIMTVRGGDPFTFLASTIKLMVATAELVLPPGQADELLSDVLCLDRETA